MPYLKHRSREVLFREIVISFLGGPAADDKPQETQAQKYCKACKAAKKDTDCYSCSMNQSSLE